MYYDLRKYEKQLRMTDPKIFALAMGAIKINRKMPSIPEGFELAIAGESIFNFMFGLFGKGWMIELDRNMSFGVRFKTKDLIIEYHEIVTPGEYCEFVLTDRSNNCMYNLKPSHLCSTHEELVMRSLKGKGPALLGGAFITDFLEDVSLSARREYMPGFNFGEVPMLKYRLRRWYHKCFGSPDRIKLY